MAARAMRGALCRVMQATGKTRRWKGPTRHTVQKRHWSPEFQIAMREQEVDCILGKVPYWEGHPLVAVMFGWPGATEEAMGEHIALYDRMGIPCVAVVPTWRETVSTHASDLRVQRVYAELQVELCNLRTDLLLHFFSTTFLQFLPPLVYFARKVTKGIVFDSCPIHRQDNFWYDSQRVPLAIDVLTKQGTISPVGPLTAFGLKAMGYKNHWVTGHVLKAREMTALEMMFAPQLYLHSEKDPLIDRRKIEELKEYNRERKDMKVWDVVWPGTAHANLLKEHPEDYEYALRSFVRAILPIPVEQLEVGRNAGAEWPPAVPSDEEMRAAYKWSRPYLSPYHPQEVIIESELKQKREQAAQERSSLSDVPQYRWPDGKIYDQPPPHEQTAKWIAENTKEFPKGVQDLRGRAHVYRAPLNAEHPPGEVPPLDYRPVYRDETKP